MSDTEVLELSKYQKQKNAIYKWREANREKWLLCQHTYFMKKMEDPNYKAANLERVKTRNKQLKKEKELTEGKKAKVGRPSKYE